MIKIHKISKNTLVTSQTLDVIKAGLGNGISMTISDYIGVSASTEATIPFNIEIVKTHVPYIKETEFYVAIRKEINLDAIGPNEQIIEGIGDDVGEYDYINSVPSKPNDLPSGFTEFYRK